MADNTYTNISDLPTLDSIGENTWVPVETTGKEGKKVDLNSVTPGTLNTDNSTAQAVNADESLAGTVNLHKVAKTGSYNDLLNKPTIPKVGYLNTTLAATQATNSAETLTGTVKLHKVSKTGKYTDLLELPKLRTNITGSLDPVYEEAITGTIKLHKIAKTGKYDDLIDKPSIPATTSNLKYNGDIMVVDQFHGAVLDANDIDSTAGPSYYEDGGEVGALYGCIGDTPRPVYAFSFYERDVSSDPKKHYDWETDWTVWTWFPPVPDGADNGYYEKVSDFDDLDEILCIVRHPNPAGTTEENGANLMMVMKIIPAKEHSGEIKLRLAYVPNDFDYYSADVDNYNDLLPYLTDMTCISTRKNINVALPGYVRITGDVYEIIQ